MAMTPSAVVLSLYWTVLDFAVVRDATLSWLTFTSPTSTLLKVMSPPTMRTTSPSRREPLLKTIVSAETANTHEAASAKAAAFFISIKRPFLA